MLKLYRASVLKAAVEGALTADWRAQHPDAEPASALLERILVERRHRWEAAQLEKFKAAGKQPPKNWKAKYKEPVAPNATNLWTLPDGWTLATCAQIGEAITGFTPPTSNPEFFGGEVPFFKPTDLDAGYHVREFRDSLTEDGAKRGRLLPPLAILVTCIGATIGKTGLARVRCTTNQQINALVVPNDLMLSEYVYWCFCSPFGQRQIAANASATTLPILNKARFESLPVPIPPLDEQVAIVEAVEEQLSTLDHLEADLDAKLKRARALRQSILRDAFAGKLVPQNPHDEPASELLKRIAAERAERARLAAVAKRTKSKVGKKVGKLKAGARRKRATPPL